MSEFDFQVIAVVAFSGALVSAYVLDQLHRRRIESTPRPIIAAAAVCLLLLAFTAATPIYVSVPAPAIYVTAPDDDPLAKLRQVHPKLLADMEQTLLNMLKHPQRQRPE